MTLDTILYHEYEKGLPQSGRHILCQERGDNLIVYQAFNPRISDFAVRNQRFGGSHYKFTRMSWIKPNFLWMMYRAGWAGKEHQQQILAIEISKANFISLLDQAVHSTFKESVYGDHTAWKDKVASSSVRLQWDPDHDPQGEKIPRRAVQLGLRGEVLKQFATDWIVSIEDITPFVKEQKALIDQKRMSELRVMKETVLSVDEERIGQKLELD
ncbi:MAG: DUF4291 domain-containing protein [Roseivirga sp.]|nr:DUF4291 domain-containing protein [Roseivirga sp.]